MGLAMIIISGLAGLFCASFSYFVFDFSILACFLVYSFVGSATLLGQLMSVTTEQADETLSTRQNAAKSAS